MNKNDLLCISKGMGKMEKIRSISTNTLTNEFCKKMHASKNTLIICGHCYSVDSLEAGRFPNQVKALQRNSDILGNKELSEKDIYQNYMFNDNIFRLQSHGDLINELHLKNLMAIVFNNVDKDMLKDRQNCTGQQCFSCRRCYQKNNDNTIIEAVKTNGRPKNLPKITVIRKAL